MKRHDVTLVLSEPAMRIAEGNAVGLLRLMAGSGLVDPYAEAVAREWVEVYCKPGTAAHAAFVEGAAPAESAFLEVALRWGDVPATLSNQGERLTVWFYLQFRGCLYESPTGGFQQRMQDLFHVKPRVLLRPHRGLPLHRTVPDDQRRVKEPKAERQGRVGTFVEEF